MEPFWRTRFRGTAIRISLADLTASRLRQMKAWFGSDYGIPNEFIALLLRGEVDAMACALWIGLQKAGKPVDHPMDLDFNLDEDFEKLEDPPPAKPKGKAKKGEGPTEESPTPDSESTASTSSTTDTSSTSEMSSD